MNQMPKDQLEAVILKFGDTTEVLHKAAIHHLRKSGKRTRAKLTFAAAQKFSSTIPLIHVAAAVELLHEASVVHDDIQDRTAHRRGQATVWKKFGSNTALLLGDHLIAAAFRCLAASNCNAVALPRLIQAMAAATSRATSGQLQQLCLTPRGHMLRDQYMTLAKHKTGALLALPLQFAAVLAATDAKTEQFAQQSGEQLGVAYQILNDLQPLQDPATLAAHEDIVDRVVTAPVVAIAEYGSNQDVFAQLVGQPNARHRAVRHCRDWVRQALARARSNAACTPTPISSVVEQFIHKYLADLTGKAEYTDGMPMPPRVASQLAQA